MLIIYYSSLEASQHQIDDEHVTKVEQLASSSSLVNEIR